MMETKKCAYCGVERPENELKQGKIIYRDRDRVTGKRIVATKVNLYCADKPCAGYDQMAHEG